MDQPRSAVNRIALAVVGVSALLAGALLVATDGSVAAHLPTWWPAARPDGALLDRAALSGPRDSGWWSVGVMTGSAAASCLLALWCVSQFRAGTRARLPLPVPAGALRTRALADVLSSRTASVTGIARSHAQVRSARRGRLHVRLRVRLQPDTAPATLLTAVDALMAEAEAAVTPYRLVTRVHFSAHAHRSPHVR
ncbi:hypothetical protein [Streptomyces fagopyri]|uniref:hypothetical protein n=1 Tax=Streptomyces fagopyri TaxID=2662397 RepID=UPI00371D62F1